VLQLQLTFQYHSCLEYSISNGSSEDVSHIIKLPESCFALVETIPQTFHSSGIKTKQDPNDDIQWILFLQREPAQAIHSSMEVRLLGMTLKDSDRVWTCKVAAFATRSAGMIGIPAAIGGANARKGIAPATIHVIKQIVKVF
jgi:hypothetical protein